MPLALDASHDLYMGHRSTIAVAQGVDAVAQGILTRLRLIRGEWYLDVSAGTPWFELLERGDIRTVEREIKRRIFDTPGVREILSFGVDFDRQSREQTVRFEVDTIFGASGEIEVTL